MTTTTDPPKGMTGLRRQPTLAHPFIPEELDAVVAGAVRVLDEIGVECHSRRVTDRLLAGPGIRRQAERIHITPSRTAALLREFRAAADDTAAADDASDRFHLSGPWCCLWQADSAAGQVRPATTAQVADAIRLLEALNVQVGVAPLEAAADTPPELRNLAGLRALLLHARTGAGMTNLPAPDQLAAVSAMSTAAGRTASAFLVPIISPLKFECRALETVLALPVQTGFHLSLAAGMPAAGSTAPLDVFGALTQSLAETLAVQLCATALERPWGPAPVRIDPFDLRYANYVVGSPDFALHDMAARELHRHLTGQRPGGGGFRSMARLPDAQAQQERATNLLFQALQGARRIGAVGQLSMDEVFSPEQAVLDIELAGSVERIASGLKGFPPTDKTDGSAVTAAVDQIARGVATGHYLDAPETVANFRTAHYHSELFRYESAQTWQQRGNATVRAGAPARVRALLDGAPPSRLPADAAREIERIYARAAAGQSA